MNPMVSTDDTPMVNPHIGSVEFLGRNPAGNEFHVSTTGLTSSPFSMLMSHDILTSNNQNGESETMSNHLNIQQYSELNCEAEQPQAIYAGLGEEKVTVLSKRKATAELAANHSWQSMAISNKRLAQLGSSPEGHGMSQLTMQNKRTSLRTSVSSKKRVHIEPSTKKPQSALKNQTMQSGVSSGTESEKLDPVRAKLRESLTAALALVLEKKASSSDADKTEDIAVVPAQKGEQTATSVSTSLSTPNIESTGEGSGSSGSQDVLLKDMPGDDWKFVGQDFQTNPIFPGEDAPFGDNLYFRDELLQGNGLSWAMDFDAQIAEMQVVESTVKDEMGYDDVDVQEKEQVVMSPESVSVRIESELFTLFGGVNKKYKEKGRSLLFNLKDRNNPELRERVMSGEISPERLCKMTAEELASKELSQWRMAKAEELDHMKVLPDSELNLRRLVKKTHKGEYQVEFDQDISVVEDVPAKVSIVRDSARSKTSGGDVRLRKGNGAKEHKGGQCTITIPGDGTDMQGLMVDDMKDLPPILSLDEFMESLDKEPPFESLSVGSGKRAPDADNETSEGGAASGTLCVPSKDSVDTSVISDEVDLKSVQGDARVKSAEKQILSEKSIMAERTEIETEVDVQSVKYDAPMESAEIRRVSEVNTLAAPIKMEHLWQGLLQLTLSSTAYVVATYKSGDKTSTKNWPASIEIKGRVRLDAFDKFLQELPKSRTRATMVIHFTLADRCTDEERCNLIDLIDSYVSDQRIGYAEPTPGVELYLCPPRSKTVDMIVTHLPKGYTEELSYIENGLVGILVWRKERIPSTSTPIASSHPKPVTGAQQFTSGKMLPDNRNGHLSSTAIPCPATVSNPPVVSNDEDDAPPGFGPPDGARDEDDLPEFNFSARPNSLRFPTSKLYNPAMASHHRPKAPPSRQVEQMRELIQKYGKSGDDNSNNNLINGVPIQPWNDDDDDDIPEWQPHQHQQPRSPLSLHAHTHVPIRPPFQQPLVPLVKPMPPLPGQGVWRHPGPSIMPPNGNPRTGPNIIPPSGSHRIRPGGAQFYGARASDREHRDRRSSDAFNRKRGF